MAYRFFDKTKPKPAWVANRPAPGTNPNTLRGWEYYNKMWDAIPPWATREGVLAIYAARKPWEETDHIVPLTHPVVCGLHCEDNLRNIDRRINQQKSNKYWPDSPNFQMCFVGESIPAHQLGLGI